MKIKIIIYCLNNDKMLKFSQINNSTKCQKSTRIQDSIQFKIQPPVSERKSRESIQQSSFLDQSQKSSCSILKNTGRSECSDKLQQQYISFKLKPSSKKRTVCQTDNDQKINSQKKSTASFSKKLIENQLQFPESQKNSLTKSPEFLCKKASPINSQKESFAGSFSQNIHSQNSQNSSFNNFKINKIQLFSNDNKIKKKGQNNFTQFQMNKTSLDRNKFNFLQSHDLQNYEAYTPYKGLKQQFERQQRISRQQKFQEAHRFDSFNQSNFKQNLFQSDQNDKLAFDNFESFQKRSCHQNKKDSSLKKRITNEIQNRDINKEFFFLTNPTMKQDTKNKEVKLSSKQKQVREFCFNISQVKFQDEKYKNPYCNSNLFSNSNQYQLFFDSKNQQKQSISSGSKRTHIRQLVEEFIQQLEHVDDKSLNQKIVSNLQNVLEEIVFKEPKRQSNLIVIEEPIFTPRQIDDNEIKKLYNEDKFKKWIKPNRDFSINKNIVNQQNDQRYDLFSQSKAQNLSPNSATPSKYYREKIRDNSSITERKNNEKKENRTPLIYKPNFDFSPIKNQMRNQIQKSKDKFSPAKNLMFSKQKQSQSTQIKINPKGSIYFNNNKNKINSRQNLKTQNTQKTWRVY